MGENQDGAVAIIVALAMTVFLGIAVLAISGHAMGASAVAIVGPISGMKGLIPFGCHDLSRRAVVYQMTGLSLREFITLKYRVHLPVLDMAAILENHDRHSLEIIKKLEDRGLKNPNQAFAICDPQQVNQGSLRELFFLCMVRENHDMPDSYLAVDGIEHGMRARIPLWIFGFLY